MKRVAIILIGVPALFVIAAFLLGLLFQFPDPPQPRFGFTGNWRSTDVFGYVEQRLPPAAEVWQRYEAWKVPTNFHGSRLYLARLGGATRQSGFRSWVSFGDTPLGAQHYTNVEFTYTDPTNGTYSLTWDLRGQHDAGFLRFDNSYRLYQLQPYGTSGETPPKLAIVGIGRHTASAL